MIANMATFDIEKFKAQRQKSYYLLLQKIARTNIEEIKNVIEHFEKIINIMGK